jgi:hypothetical protein
MRRPPKVHARSSRRGLSLLEVMLSLAILLFSITAIAQLIRLGSERARDVEDQSIATTLCQRKLTELQIGIEPIGSSGYSPFPEAGWDEWQWKAEVDGGDVPGTYAVQVFVKHDRPDGNTFEVQLAQLIMDPSLRGSNQDPPANQNSSSGTNSNSTTPSSTTPATTTPSATTPSAAAPAATTPAATKTTAPATTAPSTTTKTKGG